ncbi:MAG: hypothetical protein ACRD68_02500 [Pyrinomonadaceae bacterium]
MRLKKHFYDAHFALYCVFDSDDAPWVPRAVRDHDVKACATAEALAHVTTSARRAAMFEKSFREEQEKAERHAGAAAEAACRLMG